MIAKQQKFIEDNDIGANSTNGDKSKNIWAFILIDIDIFLEGAELEGDMEDQDNEEQYASDFIADDKSPAALGVQGEGLGPQ